MDVQWADGRRDRGVVDVAVVEPRGPKFGGGEGGGMKQQSIGKGEVASSLSSSREGEGGGRLHCHCRAMKATVWGKDVGAGAATKVAGGEAVSSSSSWLSNGVGKDPGERVQGSDDRR